MIDQLCELLKRQAEERIDANVSGIAQELSDAEDGKLTVGLAFKLQKIGGRILVVSTLAYARKFKDEGEDMIEVSDPNQPELTITTGSESVTVPADTLTRAARAMRKGEKV